MVHSFKRVKGLRVGGPMSLSCRSVAVTSAPVTGYLALSTQLYAFNWCQIFHLKTLGEKNTEIEPTGRQLLILANPRTQKFRMD